MVAAAQSWPAQSDSTPSASASTTPRPRSSSASQTSAAKTKATKNKPVHRSSRASRLARTARLKQAFVASKELQPMAQQLATLRTPRGLCGRGRLRAQPHRRRRGCRLPGAGPRLPAGQALCRGRNRAGASQARRRGAGRLRRFPRRRGEPPGRRRRRGRGASAWIRRPLSREHLRRRGAGARGHRVCWR